MISWYDVYTRWYAGRGGRKREGRWNRLYITAAEMYAPNAPRHMTACCSQSEKPAGLPAAEMMRFRPWKQKVCTGRNSWITRILCRCFRPNGHRYFVTRLDCPKPRLSLLALFTRARARSYSFALSSLRSFQFNLRTKMSKLPALSPPKPYADLLLLFKDNPKSLIRLRICHAIVQKSYYCFYQLIDRL